MLRWPLALCCFFWVQNCASEPKTQDQESKAEPNEELAFGAAIALLNETNFEHLTQAATGATSGDWLVKFCQDSVPRCNRFGQTWEKVALQLAASREAQGLPRINVATVDSEESGRLVKRFSLTSFPALLFFKQGIVYSFNGGSFSVEKIIRFVERGYASSPRMRVPPEAHIATPHDQTFLITIGTVAIGATLLYGIDLVSPAEKNHNMIRAGNNSPIAPHPLRFYNGTIVLKGAKRGRHGDSPPRRSIRVETVVTSNKIRYFPSSLHRKYFNP